MSSKSEATDALERARKVRLVILDVDGVLTDGKLFYGSRGQEGLLFNVRDGTGIKYLQRSGINVALLSGRKASVMADRASTLGIRLVVQGAKVKLKGYERLRRKARLNDEEVAYLGDDLPDIPVMRRVGLAVAVADAAPEVLAHAHYVTRAQGGAGAARELAEFILKAQGKWDAILRPYLE